MSRKGPFEDELEMVRPSRRPLDKPFPFFSLPTELRLRVYEMLLVGPGDRVVNMDVNNYRLIAPRLNCFRVSRQMFEEAYRVFYGLNIFRLYPDSGKFFKKKPLLQRLVPRYRNAITTLDLRLGPGWTDPPKVQNTEKSLGLDDLTSARILKVFIEVDPSEQIFNGFRGKDKDETWYIFWCVRLLAGILEQVPSIKTVELDAFPGIARDAPIIIAISSEIERSKRKLVWGPLRGWNEKADYGRLGIENAMAAMQI
ncbi:hypothetical protein MBLNU457_3210t1 [Dothideomycetes sp. NU457]